MIQFKHVLRRLRFGEYFVIGWMVVVGTVYTVYHKWDRFFNEQLGWAPYFIPLVVALARYLVPLIFVSTRNLMRSFKSTAIAVDFSEEMKILKAMGRFSRDCIPLFFFFIFYPSSELMLGALQGTSTIDAQLLHLDQMLFRVHLTVWMEQFISHGLTEVMSVFYALHLLLVGGIFLYLNYFCSRELFLEAMQGFMLIWIIGLTSYVFFPAVGPLYSLAHVYTRDLSAGVLGSINRVVIESLRAPRDAFPSLHVGCSTLMLVYAWRGNKWFGLALLVPTVGDWVSTIYLRYHYTVDVAAAWVVVPVVYYTVRFWMKKFPIEETDSGAPAENPPEVQAHIEAGSAG